MIRVKYEDAEFDSTRKKAIELLDEQGYTTDYIRAFIADQISTDRYHGIQLAYNSDYSTRVTKQQVLAFADDFIINYVYDKVIDLGSDCDDNYTDIIDALINDHRDDILEFNKEFKYLEDRESDDYQSEIDELNGYYYSTRGV